VVGGAVWRTPYTAARELANWAVDLWPYVNGKTIMSGVRLLEMTASDMLDVIHFLLEEDLTSAANQEQSDAKDQVRQQIYSSMYKTEYAYSAKKQTDFSALDDPLGEDDDMPVPVDPFERSGSTKPKPYTPATNFDPDAINPFGSVLDAPLR
jgi:hypothetical protein